MNTLLDYALDYASRGLPIFPCDPGIVKARAKKPLTPHGFKDASTDPVQIKKWWTKWPTALIGAAMGERGGVFAIDPDVPKKEGDADGLAAWNGLVEAHGGLSATHTHKTPSGGIHVLFKWPDGRPVTNKEGGLPPGIDVRGQGGYLIMAPSRLFDGTAYQIADMDAFWCFADAPVWLLDLIKAKRPRVEKEGKPMGFAHLLPSDEDQRRAESKHAARRRDAYVAKAFDHEVRDASRTGTNRNNRLNRAAFNLGTLVGANVLSSTHATSRLLDAARSCGLLDEDGHNAVMATIESGMTAGACSPRQLPDFEKKRAGGARTGRGAGFGGERSGTSPSPEDGDGLVFEDGSNQPLVTEDEAALQFAELYVGKLRYCHDHGAWFEWSGEIWKQNGTSKAFHYARILARKLVEDEPNAKTKSTVAKASFAGAVEKFARADPTLAVTADIWDRDSFLLGTPTGTVDLKTGKLRAADPKDGITKTTAVTPIETADCPLWRKFLMETTGGDTEMVRFLQQWAGYSLTGDTREHALCFVFGDGGNGKSVFIDVITGIAAAYATTAAMETFIASGSDKHPTDVAMLRGARMVTASETEEGRAWAESRIKSLTGGDKISARFMRQDFFTFTPSFKLTIIGNHKPILKNIDDAARRRFNLVPFTRKPATPDRKLQEKLRAEWPAILRWMIEGCLDWQETGLVRPQSILDATKEYFEAQDTFSQWIEDECDADPGNTWKHETVAKLFGAWSIYAKNAGELPGTKKSFADQLLRRGFENYKGTAGVRGFRGIRLATIDVSSAA